MEPDAVKAKMKYAGLSRQLVAIMLTTSGTLKLVSAHAFTASIARISAAHDIQLIFLWGIPLTEILLGSMLMWKCCLRASTYSALGLVVVFTIYLAINAGMPIKNCGSYGDMIAIDYGFAGFLKNAVLFFLLVNILLVHDSMNSTNSVPEE